MRRNTIIRAAAVALGLLACVWVARSAARAGLGRLLADYALASGRLDAADAAVSVSPNDAETHYAHAAVLTGSGSSPTGATAEYARAVALRPRDYALWLGLGAARDQAGDIEGAISSFAAAAREAPYYAEPRWQLGNALLRAGRRDVALAELRRAAASDPQLFPNFIELTWHAAGGDAAAFIALVTPANDAERMFVARFLIKRSEAKSAVPLALAASTSPDATRRALIAELINVGAFSEAHGLWSKWYAEGDATNGALIDDGGFEHVSGFDDSGFGWRLARGGDALKVSLDQSEPREGTRSLLLDFRGGLPPSAELASQLVVVEPGARYRLTFAARMRDLVTGGPPLVRVVDARAGAVLAESSLLSLGTGDGWREFTVEFVAPARARAVRVLLARRPCVEAACPAFGQLWLDDFHLNKL